MIQLMLMIQIIISDPASTYQTKILQIGLIQPWILSTFPYNKNYNF